MTSWRMKYWRTYNVLVRVLGLVALILGLGFMVWALVRWLEPAPNQAEEVSALVLLGAGVLSAGLGLAILRAPSYRPDLGDAAMHFDPFGARHDLTHSKRSWWTGDR